MTEFQQTLMLAGTGVFVLFGLLAFLQHHLHLFFGRPTAPANVFVRWLSEEQKEKLRLASIPYTPTSAGTGEDGISFSPQSFARAKRLLKARVIEVFPPSGRNFEEAVLTFSKRRDSALNGFKTEVAGNTKWYDLPTKWKRYQLARFIDESLMPSVRKDIVVHLQHGHYASPATDGKFHVYLYSTPVNQGGGVYAPTRILGGQIANRTTAFAASGTGVPVIEPLSNFAVAELVDNNLYVHLDLVRQKSLKTRRGLLLRVLQQVDGELAADKFLEELIASVKADNQAVKQQGENAEYRVEGEGITGRRLVVLSSLVREILAPVVHSNVIIRDCSGQNATPVEDGNFRIFLHSSPIGSPCMVPPEQVWGHRMLKRETAFAPSANGIPLIDDNGFIVGEIVGRNLYLHMHFIHYGAKMEAALAAKLLLEVRKELQSDQSEQDDIARKVSDHYVQECARQFAVGKAKKVSSSDLAAAQAAFHEHLRGALLEEFDLLRLQAAPAEEIGREFDELTQLANVRGVRVEGNTIVVSTDTLYCVHPKSHVRYEIGAFDIQIDTATNMIKWFNKTRKVSGGNGSMNAPHVDPNGNACMGNTKDLFPQLIQKREFASAVQLAIAFVEAVNIDDTWGKYIVNWPVAR